MRLERSPFIPEDLQEPLMLNNNSVEDFHSLRNQHARNISNADTMDSSNQYVSAFARSKRISFPQDVRELVQAGLDTESRTDHKTEHRLNLDDLTKFSACSSSFKIDRQTKKMKLTSVKSMQRVDSAVWDQFAQEINHIDRGRSIFGFTVVYPPEHWFVSAWDATVLAVDAIYSAFLVPIIVFFFVAENPDFTLGWISLFVGSLFFVDLWMGFHQGLLVETSRGRSGMLLDGKMVARRYLKSGRFWVNVISALSLPLTFASFFSDFGEQYYWIRSGFYCLQLVRMSRVAQVIKGIFREMYGYKNQFLGHSFSTNELFIMGIIYTALFYFNIAGCIWYATARLTGFDHSWINRLPASDEDIDGMKKPRLYITSVYFIMVTVTTVGYGDIVPRTWEEQLVVMFIIGAGSMLFAFYLAIFMDLFASYGNYAREAKNFRDKMVEVNKWMNEFNLPMEMKRDVHHFFGIQHLKQKYHTNVLQGLPTYIRGKIAKHITRDVVGGLELFKNLGCEEVVDHVCYRLRMVSALAGEVLCQEGDEANSIWIIQSGEVGMYRWDRLVRVLRAPAACAEIAYFEDVIPSCRQHQFCLECTVDCTIWQLNVSELRSIFCQLSDSEHCIFNQAIQDSLKQNCERFCYQDEQLESVRRDVDNYVARLQRGHSVFDFPKDVLYKQLNKDLDAHSCEEVNMQQQISVFQNHSYDTEDNKLGTGLSKYSHKHRSMSMG